MSRLTRHSAIRPRAAAASVALTMAALLASASGVSAAELYATRTVYYKSSELATDAGTRALYLRIAEAAAMACPPEDSRRPEATAVSRECQRQAIASAVARIGNARLAAIFAHKLWRYRAL